MQKTRIVDKAVSGTKVSDKMVTTGGTRTRGSININKGIATQRWTQQSQNDNDKKYVW